MGRRTNTAVWLEKYRRWQIKVQKDGERRTFTCPTPGRTGQRECNKKADEWLDNNIVDQSKRVSVLYDSFVESLKLTTSYSNWIKIESYGKNWIKPAIGNKKISALTEQMLQNILDKGFASGLSKKTLMNIRAAITSFLKYCRKSKCSTLVPESLVIPKGAVTSGKKILQPSDLMTLFSKDEITLYNKPVKDEFINAYRFQVLTGLRPGELIGLMWEDISGTTVHVRRSINAYGQETKGKNENAVRKFELTVLAQNVLKAQWELTAGQESVFEIPSLSTYEKRWRRYSEQNGITIISPYEMRHTFVSVVKELPDGQIKPLVGHSKNMDTYGVYGHEVDGDARKTANGVEALFKAILEIES